MKIKTTELVVPALNWAVGVIEIPKDFRDGRPSHCYSPATDWAQGGPIIEREGIHSRPCYNDGKRNTGHDAWRADIDFKDGVMTLGKFTEYGETALIAAMRCHVASKLGDEVEIPDELARLCHQMNNKDACVTPDTTIIEATPFRPIRPHFRKLIEPLIPHYPRFISTQNELNLDWGFIDRIIEVMPERIRERHMRDFHARLQSINAVLPQILPSDLATRFGIMAYSNYRIEHQIHDFLAEFDYRRKERHLASFRDFLLHELGIRRCFFSFMPLNPTRK